MTKGLTLARLFHAAGHTVIGADFEPAFLPLTSGHFSRSLKTFHRLAKPDGSREKSAQYTQSLVDIIRKERVDLWVSCSGVASAVEDGQAKEVVELITDSKAIQYDVPTTKKLHEKHSFMEYTSSLGLPTPDSHTVTSRAAVLRLLEDAQGTGRKYIMKFIGTDDTVRGDMTLLPFSTHAQTKAHVSRLQISEERPWILQQFIDGPEYCTHALVVRGEVKVFVACPSAELLMHYESLPVDSALSRNMLRFTQEFAAAGGPSFTGHLSFDFLVDAAEAKAAEMNPNKSVKLYPIECNPRAHTAVALFNDTYGMADAYLSLLEPPTSKVKTNGVNGATPEQPIFPRKQTKYYWIGHDLVTRVILPFLSLFVRDGSSFSEVYDDFTTFVEHFLFWKDGTYEVWDPLPAFWLYHVYWPSQFFFALVFGRKWSRVNVSTTKMFGC